MSVEPAPEGEEIGPAMQALNERQRVFVLAFLSGGGKNAKVAAKLAGYDKGSAGSLEVQAHRLTRDVKVLAAIREESMKRFKSFGPEMFGVLLSIARSSKAAAGDRRKAATDVLDRIGYQAITEHVVTVQDNRSRADLIRELIEGLREIGGDAPKLIDVTPEKVADGE